MPFNKQALDTIGHAFPSFDPRAGTILITCGNGVVAYRIVVRLLLAGYASVRVGVPDPTSVPELAEKGAEVVEFCWEKPETFSTALANVHSVFIALPHHTDWEKQFDSFLKATKKAGVANVVKLSFAHALHSEADTMSNFANATRVEDPLLGVPLVQMHRACDAHLMKAKGISNYTILFASHFMSNPLVYQSDSLRKEQKFYGASNGKGVNYVSPNDVAEVAVRALLAPKDHHRTGYTLTGPTAIKDFEIADLLGYRLDRRVTYVDKTLVEFAHDARATDWGPASDVIYLEDVKASGSEEFAGFISKDITKVCGRPAETYEEYLLAQDWMTPQELAYLKP